MSMTRTKRIYNRRLKKAQRRDLSLPNCINGVWVYKCGIPLTWRSYICMGMCKMCRDPNKETKLIRKRRKEQLRFDLKSELKKPICHGYACLCCDESIYRFCND